ncbi:hypothetical protein Q7C36_006936 [Tachysurus vachellii]|uniref:Uncharacterized protein n=1 Tax=Tachysurus vachellii TaxID=175792 RepID=A0AA88NAA0_TACVA|nr:hypothetical protein Q7C36_006936 [Tachysurus vachellii]
MSKRGRVGECSRPRSSLSQSKRWIHSEKRSGVEKRPVHLRIISSKMEKMPSIFAETWKRNCISLGLEWIKH